MMRQLPTAAREWTVVGVTVALLALVPLAVATFWIQLLALTGILAIVTMGFNLTFGVAGQINLAIGGFFAVGAYASALLTTKASWPIGYAALAGLGIAGTLAYLVAWPTSRLRGLYVAMATLALQLGITAFLVHTEPITNGPVGVFGVKRPVVGGFRFATEQSYYYLILVVATAVFLVMRALLRSRTGRAYEAIREDEDAARSLGIRTALYKVSAFVVGALCASLAGSLYAHFNRFVSPESFDVVRSIQILTMAVVGGLGSNVGAVVGAAVVVLLPEYLIGLLPEGAPNVGLYQSLIFGALMLLVLIFAPGGIAGLGRRLWRRLGQLRRGRPPSAPGSPAGSPDLSDAARRSG